MIKLVSLDFIEANAWQTRQAPDMAHIAELAKDIKANGLMQTPIGRELEGSGRVQLAFGHNRLSAYRMLHDSEGSEEWARMPVDVRDDLSDERMAIMAWSENNARKDLSPVEQAGAIQRMMETFSWNQERVAEKLNLARATVANKLRLLKLPAEIRQANLEGKISERQASALLGLYEIAEPMRKTAEGFGADETRPTRIIGDALNGASSDEIRRRVDLIVMRFTPKAQQKPAAPEASPAPKASQPYWLPKQEEVNHGATEGTEKKTGDEKQPVMVGMDMAVPGSERSVTIEVPPPAKPIQEERKVEPAPAPEPIKVPASWAESTVQVSITLFPKDGELPGRNAAVSGRLNSGIPVMRMIRSTDMAVLTASIEEVLRTLKQQVEG